MFIVVTFDFEFSSAYVEDEHYKHSQILCEDVFMPQTPHGER